MLLPAVWSLLKAGKVQVRVVKDGNPIWRPLKAKDVSALHVGVMYFTMNKQGNDVYNSPWVRYLRHSGMHDLAMDYFKNVVRVMPTSEEPRPDMAALLSMKEKERDSKELNVGEIALALMPPGNDQAWYAVVEIELPADVAKKLGLAGTIVLICMVQTVAGEWLVGDVYVFPAWALEGRRKGIADSVQRAMDRATMNWDELRQFRQE